MEIVSILRTLRWHRILLLLGLVPAVLVGYKMVGSTTVAGVRRPACPCLPRTSRSRCGSRRPSTDRWSAGAAARRAADHRGHPHRDRALRRREAGAGHGLRAVVRDAAGGDSARAACHRGGPALRRALRPDAEHRGEVPIIALRAPGPTRPVRPRWSMRPSPGWRSSAPATAGTWPSSASSSSAYRCNRRSSTGPNPYGVMAGIVTFLAWRPRSCSGRASRAAGVRDVSPPRWRRRAPKSAPPARTLLT